MKLRSICVVVATALAAAACGSTTSGRGAVSGTTGGSSSADFPSAPASASSPPSAAATSGAATAVPSAPAGSTSAVGPHGTPIATRTVHTPDGPYVVQIWATATNGTCTGHAYGKPVIAFLKKHPCQRLRRILGTTTVNGRPVAIAESATSFGPSGNDPYKITGQFVQLLERDGTGSLNDLLREGRRIPQTPGSIPAKEVFKVLSQDNVVTVWDVWYLDGPTSGNDPALVKMIEDLFLLL